jgi:small subunit ribosomal protein S35
MATALQGLRFTVRSCSCRPVAHRYATRSTGRRRPFSTTPLRRQKQDGAEPRIRAALDKLSNAPDAERGQWLESQVSSFDERIKESEEAALATIERQVHPPKFDWQRRPKAKIKDTFLNMGESEAVDGFPEDDEDEHDDISSIAHGELEHHREMRHYARLAAWEMPMLAGKCTDLVDVTVLPPMRRNILDKVANE